MHEIVVVNKPYSGTDVLPVLISGSTLAHPFPWTLHLLPYAWRPPQLLRPVYITGFIMIMYLWGKLKSFLI